MCVDMSSSLDLFWIRIGILLDISLDLFFIHDFPCTYIRTLLDHSRMDAIISLLMNIDSIVASFGTHVISRFWKGYYELVCSMSDVGINKDANS